MSQDKEWYNKSQVVDLPADVKKAKETFLAGDRTTAIDILIPLAEAGEVYAQLHLGLIYNDGDEVNDAEAAKWYQRAAEAEEPHAQYLLGMMYYDGKGVAQNCRKAAKWIRRAAKARYTSIPSGVDV